MPSELDFVRQKLEIALLKKALFESQSQFLQVNHQITVQEIEKLQAEIEILQPKVEAGSA